MVVFWGGVFAHTSKQQTHPVMVAGRVGKDVVMLRLGNLSPEEFAERVDTVFTPDELEHLNKVRSGFANLTSADDFHIFDSPAVAVSVGSADARVLQIFRDANTRAPFNREVPFDIDEGWKHAEGTKQ